MNFNTLSKQIYDTNRKIGWWDNPNECLFQKLQLVSTEIAEATEGERKDLMDDHLPRRKMGEVELADALIRTLDLGGRMGLEYLGAVNYQEHFDFSVNNSVGRKHLAINVIMCDFAKILDRHLGHHRSNKLEFSYSMLITVIDAVANDLKYDLEGAVEDKLAYNAQRFDHKRENREKTGGKKF